MIYPKGIKKGDTIGIVAPSGPFRATTLGEIENALNEVLKATEIPAANDIQCGNYRDLSLFGAKEYAKEALNRGFSLSIYGE